MEEDDCCILTVGSWVHWFSISVGVRVHTCKRVDMLRPGGQGSYLLCPQSRQLPVMCMHATTETGWCH